MKYSTNGIEINHTKQSLYKKCNGLENVFYIIRLEEYSSAIAKHYYIHDRKKMKHRKTDVSWKLDNVLLEDWLG